MLEGSALVAGSAVAAGAFAGWVAALELVGFDVAALSLSPGAALLAITGDTAKPRDKIDAASARIHSSLNFTSNRTATKTVNTENSTNRFPSDTFSSDRSDKVRLALIE
jgi:hypothetical protein